MSDLVHNERVKLTASLLNAAASGILITGVIAPAVAVLYGVPGPAGASPWLIGLGSASWVAISAALHLVARTLLGKLR